MNDGDPENREYWIQIITTIPEISSTDHSSNQTTDKRIITIFCQKSHPLKILDIPFYSKSHRVTHLTKHSIAVIDQM
jgi:hypothetical protein